MYVNKNKKSLVGKSRGGGFFFFKQNKRVHSVLYFWVESWAETGIDTGRVV